MTPDHLGPPKKVACNIAARKNPKTKDEISEENNKENSNSANEHNNDCQPGGDPFTGPSCRP